jgi:hypothetical protein
MVPVLLINVMRGLPEILALFTGLAMVAKLGTFSILI